MPGLFLLLMTWLLWSMVCSTHKGTGSEVRPRYHGWQQHRQNTVLFSGPEIISLTNSTNSYWPQCSLISSTTTSRTWWGDIPVSKDSNPFSKTSVSTTIHVWCRIRVISCWRWPKDEIRSKREQEQGRESCIHRTMWSHVSESQTQGLAPVPL